LRSASDSPRSPPASAGAPPGSPVQPQPGTLSPGSPLRTPFHALPSLPGSSSPGRCQVPTLGLMLYSVLGHVLVHLLGFSRLYRRPVNHGHPGSGTRFFLRGVLCRLLHGVSVFFAVPSLLLFSPLIPPGGLPLLACRHLYVVSPPRSCGMSRGGARRHLVWRVHTGSLTRLLGTVHQHVGVSYHRYGCASDMKGLHART
jgi:hypothetical protein